MIIISIVVFVGPKSTGYPGIKHSSLIPSPLMKLAASNDADETGSTSEIRVLFQIRDDTISFPSRKENVIGVQGLYMCMIGRVKNYRCKVYC